MAVKIDHKSPHKAEEAEVSNCVLKLIQAFSNGLNVFKKLRDRRRKRKAHKESQALDAATSDELQLSRSLKRGPYELAEAFDTCYLQTGEPFAKGDAIAHASLAETLMKLNTGLVAIITSFLNHDKKSGKVHLNLDYKSLTNLSESSRREALQSMTQLYLRLSQSQLQLQSIKPSCATCGSSKHASCSSKSSSASSSNKEKDKKRYTSSRQRLVGTTVTRMPLKSSTHPQLVVVRPKNSRRGSSSSNSSSKSQSQSQSPSSSAYTSPLVPPLPLYIAEEPYEIETNGVIEGVLGGSMPLAGNGRRRKDSFNVHDPRPTTWPDAFEASNKYPYVMQEYLHLPTQRLPSFAPTSRRSSSSSQRKTPSPPPHPLRAPPAPPISLPLRRRLDKVTPSSYTFASDSTKLGEIPQRNWAMPWDYEEADRLNNEAVATEYPSAPVTREEKVSRKKGLFKWRK
ncbi:hypothetical protein GQ44DRAFT_612517 [Phaeosphaeriaceae sp. PMI808]|nr:hypothetical protein GQ44DRAFT_612517 [Phaeosphaeriaceae sp. PMI808]